MGTSERKAREQEARRDLILRAAKATFAEKGLVAATIDDVAQRAELAKGTIYRYFKSKEDVFHLLVEEGLIRLVQRFRAAISAGAPADENLRRIADAYLDFYREEPDYFWICYFGTARDPGGSHPPSEAVRSAGSACIGQVAQVIRGGIESGIFDAALDPMEAAVLTWSASSGIIFVCEREVGPIKLTHYQVDHLLRANTELMIRAFKARP
jgi:AcrR family transcriptional regulator